MRHRDNGIECCRKLGKRDTERDALNFQHATSLKVEAEVLNDAPWDLPSRSLIQGAWFSDTRLRDNNGLKSGSYFSATARRVAYTRLY